MPASYTLRDLLDRGVPVRAAEAVAIVQRLMHHDAGEAGATGPCGPLGLGNVEIDSDGRVRCVATAATPSVYEAAALLQELLSAGRGAIPGALRYTLGRALLEVDAPPFESRQHFGASLERFECGPRAEVIAALHARASSRATGTADRRRATATHAALRRELRDADLRLDAAITATRPAAGPEPLRRSAGPIAGCLLAGAALIVAGGAALPAPRRPASGPVRATAERRVRTRDIALPLPLRAGQEPASLVRTAPRHPPHEGSREARGGDAAEKRATSRTPPPASLGRQRSRRDRTDPIRVGQPVPLRMPTAVYDSGDS